MGVSILGYNVTSTSYGNSALSSWFVVNTTEYIFFPKMLNDTYKIEISAVNEAGQGKSTSLTLSFSKGIHNGRHFLILI